MAIDYQGLVTHGLAIQIAAKIREAILEGRLKVDERLPTEEELAARFSVSRPTIREALKRLAVVNAASLLVSLGEFSLGDVAEARTELELLCCRLAARRRTAAHLEVLAAEIERQRQLGLSDEDFCASDVRFHRALVEAAGNPALDFLAAGVLESLQPAVNMVVFRFRSRRGVSDQHERIHRALAARDAHGASTARTAYMRDLRRHYARAQARGAQPARAIRHA